jgi:crotonobetainyl-CoA:carnitine CoA-transferase CaiB-like acyl-CoA transferase
MFNEIKVLELASVLAGPSVGQFFAELGATVWKVENPNTGGDVTRSWKSPTEQTDDRSAYFCSVNWGKVSISADLHTEAGLQSIYALVSQADIVIASYKPGDAVKLGVDYKTLAKINPRIIYGMITGYGEDNPRVGYDAVIQAEAGFMYMNGEPDGASLKMPVALIDVLAAHQLKQAILIALLQRQQTGKGDCVQVSLVQAAVSALVNQATNYLIGHSIPKKHGSAHPNIAPYGETFHTADGKEIILAVGNDVQFAKLCGILTLPTVLEDDRFRTNTDRVRNRGVLNGKLQEAFRMFTSVSLLEKLHTTKVPAGVVQKMDEVFKMPEVEPILLTDQQFKGVRTYVGSHKQFNVKNSLTAPPSIISKHE